ncbi:hypothetical protein [Ralstonia chuxiongensis]|uniref:hypothetical protein n=1 Tax=Ralstonia chuxiongensis TaxID=2957504 RepID=UPI0028F5106E|nr:hypothetical protein [Ralstonia chuxiongensis]CAJ0776279.1 hypothetical protein R8510_04222 [Ralstonia chuxiongensis]
MSDAHAAFCDFYRNLPDHLGGDVDVTPRARLCRKSKKTAHKRWLQAMRPYTASALWLEILFLEKGADTARRAYLKLGAERKELIKIGFRVVFENRYRPEPGYAYHRPEMFVGVAEKPGDFPVKTLANMRLATYRRLIDMGKVPV